MPLYLLVEKKVGQTPLQVLDALREKDPQYADVPLTYAGRLDPMASGQLLVLVGEECKNREKYLGLDKEYEFEVLLGFESDTGDILGLAQYAPVNTSHTEEEYKAAGETVLGVHELPYPAFSSKPVAGKPLFHHALSGTLSDVDMPTTRMEVKEMTFLQSRTTPLAACMDTIRTKIEQFHPPYDPQKVGSDFRKNEILAHWQQLAATITSKDVTILTYRVRVGAGTYIRALVPQIAAQLDAKGLAYTIHRTRIFL